jgi:hypothetical protein
VVRIQENGSRQGPGAATFHTTQTNAVEFTGAVDKNEGIRKCNNDASVCFREVLGFSRDEIISWFDRVVARKIEDSPYVPDYENLQRSIDASRAAIEKLENAKKGMSAKLRGRQFLKNGYRSCDCFWNP